MKKLSLVLASLLVSSFAFAAQQAELVCNAPAKDPSGPIQGHTLIVTQEDGYYKGLLYPQCRVCMVMPTELRFENKQLRGMQLIYSGRGASLNISLESFVATKTHPARLTLIDSNGRKTMSFMCTSK